VKHGSEGSRLAAAALCLAAVACGRAPERRNVLLVTLDTTRADRLACYGGSAAVPNLDRLAAEGALFAHAVSTAGLTPMSHASILTGLNNYRHGLRVFYSETASYTLDPSNTTLPEILSERGWQTAAFVSAYPVSEFYGVDQGFDTFDTGSVDPRELDLSRQQEHEELWNETGQSSTQRRSDLTVGAALSWLEDHRRGPWCVWVHLFDAHDFSMVPPADWIARFGIAYDKQAQVNDLEWRERLYDP
jgi:arylsulfatase A-like enzyme